MMGGGHVVHENQAISSTTMLITHTFCMENEKHLTPRGLGACQHDPIMQVSHGEANFIFPLRNYSTFTPGSFGVQPCTAPCSSPFGAYLPTVSSDNQRTRRRRLLRCIHNRLAFNRAACTSIARFLLKAVSFTESSCRKRVLPNLRMRAALINSPERVWSTACHTQRQKLSGKKGTSLKMNEIGKREYSCCCSYLYFPLELLATSR